MKVPFIMDTGPMVAWFCPQDFKFYRQHGHELITLLAPFPA
jgi:hypothetical protein